MTNLESESHVILSGANGAGKSLVLEAMYFAGSASLFGIPNLSSVGPWGPQCEVKLELWLTSEERHRLEELRDATVPDLTGDAPERVATGFVLTAVQGRSLLEPGWPALLIRGASQAGLPFGQIDYLPADRQMPRGEQAAVSTEVLSDERRQQLRQQAYHTARDRHAFALSGIQPVLATLDYLDLIAARAGESSDESDFDRLTSAFERATGKRIPRPVPDPTGISGTRLFVETAAGVQHSLDELSSGEQAALGLMFYVRRLSSSGGVLLVDEPELHLHPALHSLLITVLGDIAQRAQIWTVTHSTRVVATASIHSLVHIKPATETDENQAVRARDDDARIAVLEDLGIGPAVGLQADLLLVVEGDSDRQLLERLLPVETGRAQFVIAGQAEGVTRTSRAFNNGFSGSWVAVRDRDFLDDADRTELMRADASLFIWPEREIENELLFPPLIALAFSRAGREIAADEVRDLLLGLFERQREQIKAQLVETELRKRHEVQVRGGPSISQLTAYLNEVNRVASSKLSDLGAVEAEVEGQLGTADTSKRLRLLDGKRALGELVTGSPFSSRSDLVDALVAALRVDGRVCPPGIEALRQRILRTATATAVAATNAEPST